MSDSPVQPTEPAIQAQEDVKQDLEVEEQDEQVELVGALCLEEEVDMKALRVIRDNFKEVFRRVGGMWIPDNCEYVEADEKTAFTLINDLYRAKLKSNKVLYHFLRRLKSGRRFAKNSLQGISRKIRHTIACNIYHDVDMKNAHPTFCLELCNTLKFKHKVLEKYVKNRDECLTNWMGVEVLEQGNKRTLKTKDEVKEYFLKILNGGGNGKTNNEELNDYWEAHQTLLSNFFKHPDYKRFRERAIKKYKEEQKKPDGKKYDNKKGTCINYYMCEIENLALTHIEKYLEENGIKYGTLCFDGLMIYKKDVKDTHDLLSKLEAVLLEKMGFQVKLAIKEMNETIDISDLKAKEDIKTTEEDYALYLLDKLKDDIKYDFSSKELWFWCEEEALWREQKPKNLRTFISKILLPYIEQSPDPEIIEEQTKLLKSDAKQSAIVRTCEPYIEQRRDDSYISENFNRKKGLFPIIDKQVVDLRTSTVRERTKEDCFTKTTTNKLVKVSQEDRAYIMKYYEDLLTPYEGKDEEVFGKNYKQDPTHQTEFIKHRDGLISIFSYAMTTENHLKKFPNFIGERDGGKSACVEHHTSIFGDFGGPANNRLFVAQKNSSCHDTEIFSLKGKKMVFLSETSTEQKYNEVLIKAITGGDQMDIRRASATTTVKEKFDTLLFVATNNMCQFQDEAFKDRLLCYNFCNKFEKNAEVPVKLASLRNQFFSVLVEYAKRFYDNKLNIEWSKYALEYTQRKKDEQDTIKKWLSESVEIVKYDPANPDHEKDTFFLAKPNLYLSYADYWSKSKRAYEGKMDFYKKFEKMFGLPEAKKFNNAVLKNKMGWAGIKQILDEPEDDGVVFHEDPKPIMTKSTKPVSDLDHGITQAE
jgi:phage/plasmid-associated DNA primase